MKPQRTGRPRTEILNPQQAAQAIEAYARTGSLRRTADETGLGKDTVRRLIARQPVAWHEARHEMARKFFARAEECLELSGEKLSAMSGPQLGILSAVCTDKAIALLDDKQGTQVAIQVNVGLEAEARLRLIEAEIARRRAGTSPEPSKAATKDTTN